MQLLVDDRKPRWEPMQVEGVVEETEMVTTEEP